MRKKTILIMTMLFTMLCSVAFAGNHCYEKKVHHDNSKGYFCQKHNSWHDLNGSFYCEEHKTHHKGFGCCGK